MNLTKRIVTAALAAATTLGALSATPALARTSVTISYRDVDYRDYRRDQRRDWRSDRRDWRRDHRDWRRSWNRYDNRRNWDRHNGYRYRDQRRCWTEWRYDRWRNDRVRVRICR